jgi:hypothetical protein
MIVQIAVCRALAVVGMFCLSFMSMANASTKYDLWAPYTFLIGDWTADTTADGGTGRFSFVQDLENKILVRRNQADYPAAKDRSASHHEDLMIVYVDAGATVKAIYFDNEGHVINYTVHWDAGRLTFVSDPQQGSPTFRLSYTKSGDNTVKGQFEIAPPGKPDAFSMYKEWMAHKADARSRL